MPQKQGIKAELSERVEVIIEVAQLLVKAGYDLQLVQQILIDPLLNAADARINYGNMPGEEISDVT